MLPHRVVPVEHGDEQVDAAHRCRPPVTARTRGHHGVHRARRRPVPRRLDGTRAGASRNDQVSGWRGRPGARSRAGSDSDAVPAAWSVVSTTTVPPDAVDPDGLLEQVHLAGQVGAVDAPDQDHAGRRSGRAPCGRWSVDMVQHDVAPVPGPRGPGPCRGQRRATPPPPGLHAHAPAARPPARRRASGPVARLAHHDRRPGIRRPGRPSHSAPTGDRPTRPVLGRRTGHSAGLEARADRPGPRGRRPGRPDTAARPRWPRSGRR